MFCTNCGKELPDDSAFCTSCGTKLNGQNGAQSAPQAAASAQAAPQAAAPEPTAPQMPAVAPTGNAPKKGASKNKKKFVIIGIVAAVIVVIVAAAVLISIFSAQSEQQRIEARDKAYDALDGTAIVAELADQSELLKGVASNDYVSESPYEVEAFEIADKIPSDEKEQVNVTGAATVQNEFFKETAELDLDFAYDQGSSQYKLMSMQIGSIEVVPVRGIENDAAHGLENLTAEDAPLSSQNSCSVSKISDEKTYWFGKTGNATVYRYRFTDNKWEFVDEGTKTGFLDVSGVYGNYEDQRSGATYDHGYFTSFEIRKQSDETIIDPWVNFMWEPAEKVANQLNGDVEGHFAIRLSLDGDTLRFNGVGSSAQMNVQNVVGYLTPDGIQFTGGYFTKTRDPGAGIGEVTINMEQLKLYKVN